jgi:hypothetical protein
MPEPMMAVASAIYRASQGSDVGRTAWNASLADIAEAVAGACAGQNGFDRASFIAACGLQEVKELTA